MNPGTESLTAKITAAYRAREAARPEPLCRDVWARWLVGDDGPALAEKGDAHAPDMALGVVLRTAWLDEHVDAFKGSQVIVLGAGLDTRAARLSRDGVRFFEVDHPATQAYKRDLLLRAPGYPLGAATLVPCDFERDDFVVAMERAGVSRTEPTLVLWEGVIPYLTEASVSETITKLTRFLDRRSALVFDYLGPAVSAADEFVRDVGEPFLFTPTDIAPLVTRSGFAKVTVTSMPDLRAKKLPGAHARSALYDRWFLAEAS
jgi:methyltransferase (TIGR00027 family)